MLHVIRPVYHYRRGLVYTTERITEGSDGRRYKMAVIQQRESGRKNAQQERTHTVHAATWWRVQSEGGGATRLPYWGLETFLTLQFSMHKK